MNNKLREAIEGGIIIPEAQAFASAETTDHVFSLEYTRKTEKLIKRQKKKYYPLICTSARRTACVIIAFFVISITTVLSVEALRTPFHDFITRVFSSHSEVRSFDDGGDYPDKIENIYEIKYDLSDYQVIYTVQSEKHRNIDYQHESDIICFAQDTVKSYNKNFNTENAELESVDIDGHEAIGFLDNQNYYTLIWNNGEYVIQISSNIGKDALIEIAKSVQKVES